MQSRRDIFFKHLAQTSLSPPAFEFVNANGSYVTDASGKKYLDFISGISVSSFGHNNATINKAIHEQVEKHLHLMVYGEYIISAQTDLCSKLCALLPDSLQNVFLTNSGSEAVEGAMKLAKRYTGRTGFISFRNSYHGSTQGALSICGNEMLKNSYRPLLPDIQILEFNQSEQLELIDEHVAAVYVELIQGEAGVNIIEEDFLKKLRKRCSEKKVLLVFDEIQTGMGRTGSLFAFEQFGIVPDILLVGKAFGGGMPLGAFISSQKIMSVLTIDPVLGHITTSGGHPVSCAASLAALKFITGNDLIGQVFQKEKLIRSLLVHDSIKEIRGKGLLLAVEFGNEKFLQDVINRCYENGLLTDWFLFSPTSMRLAPPLTISEEEIREACRVIRSTLDVPR